MAVASLPVISVQMDSTQMSEGRRTQVVLLDDRRLDIVVQPKLFVNELLNIVASHCHLKDPDKQYFGLAFYDESQQCHWLQNERHVLDHDYPRKFVVAGATLTLFHQPKYYVESITQLAHASCVELMFLHTRTQLTKGLIETDNVTICQLGAYALQACFGDFTEATTARSCARRMHLLPPRLVKEAVATGQCEDSILEFYQNQRGMSKGMAIVNYMTTVERLQTYGVLAYEVQDKAGVSLTLGISSRGIYQYELNTLEKPRRVFYWKQLENLYYRDRKFSIEVNDIGRVTHTLSSFNVYEDAIQEPEDESDDLTEAICDPSTQVSVSRRAFLPSGVYVHVFWCESAQLCKTIWSLAIAQHQFYLDKKAASKKLPQTMHHSAEALAEKLDKLTDDGTSSIGRNSSECSGATPRLASSLSSASLRSFHSSERSEEDKQRDLESCKRLKLRRIELEQLLIERTKELKDVCVREGELTGELPAEIRRALAPGEAEPKIKRRVGTAFTITSETVTKHRKADQITKLEADVDIHRKIVAAALKLASDSTTNKSVRRKRRRDYEAARQRLRELEQRLHQLRISSSKPDLPNAHLEGALLKLSENNANFRVCKSLPGTPHGSSPDLSMPEPLSTCGRLDFGEHAKIQLAPFSPSRRQVFSNRPPNLPLPPTSPRRRAPSDQGGFHKGLQHSTSFPNDHRSVSPLVNNDLALRRPDRSPTTEHASGEFLTKPPHGSNGYRSQSTYQSSYRCQNFPTLSNGNGIKTSSIADSNYSLSANSASGSETLAATAVDHSVGAYNIPNQRTSWDYECLSEMNSGVVAALLQGSSESLNIGTVHASSSDVAKYSTPDVVGRSRKKGPISGFSSDFYCGSLDRRLLNQRQRDNWRPTPGSRLVDANGNADECSTMLPSTPEIVGESNESSPTRCPLSASDRNYSPMSQHSVLAQSISPRFVHKLLSTSPLAQGTTSTRLGNGTYSSNGNGLETTKPYETADLIKYGGSIRQFPNNAVVQNGRFLSVEQNLPIRKLSSPSPTTSSASSPPPSSPNRNNFGSPKRVENWWTSQVATNNARRNYSNSFSNSQKSNVVGEAKLSNGDSSPGQEALSWYDDQDPSSPLKTPTIV